MSHIIVKKPKPEKVCFSNVNKQEMVKKIKKIFKGENYIQIPIRIKDKYINNAYAKDCWKMQAMEYFKERKLVVEWWQSVNH